MIPDIIPVNNWRGNSYATEFDFDFLINSESELKVLHTDANDYQTTLKLNIDYTINQVGNENGSSINFPILGSEYSVLKENEVITLMLDIPVAQTTPFATSAVLSLKSLEFALDYIVRLIQMMSRKIERCVKVQEGDNVEPEKIIENIEESEHNSLVSANNSATSAQESEDSAALSKLWATLLGGKVNNEDYSSKYYAQQSQSFANVASEQKGIVVNAANEKITEINTAKTNAVNSINSTATSQKNEMTALKNEAEAVKNEIVEGGLYKYQLFDIVPKDHVLTYAESNGFALLGTYVYKEAVAGERYGYPDFYNKCLEEYEAGEETDIIYTDEGVSFKARKNKNGHIYYDISEKETVDALYKYYGQAFFYGIDTENERIFLPRKSQNEIILVAKKEATSDDPTWYNLYSDGWCEQGGHVTSGSGTNTVTLLKSYRNSTDYFVQVTANGVNTAAYTPIYTKTASNTFIIYSNAGGLQTLSKDWVAYGYIGLSTTLSKYEYMVVGNTTSERAITDVIDITTTENDTLPLFYNTYSQQDMTTSGAFVNASLGAYLDGNIYKTAYAHLENLGIGAKFDAGEIKAYGDESITDYDLVLNQENMTFRLPLLNGERILVAKKAATSDDQNWYNLYADGWCEQGGLNAKNNTSITLLKPYKDTNYSILWALDYGGGDLNWEEATGNNINNNDRTSNSFKVGTRVGNWRAVGYTSIPTVSDYTENVNLYYKLNNVVQNQQILDVAGVTSALNDKVSRDEFIEFSLETFVPDFEKTITVSSLPYTIPDIGWWMHYGVNKNGTVLINNVTVDLYSFVSNNWPGHQAVQVILKKGDVISCTTDAPQYMKFVPLKGI